MITYRIDCKGKVDYVTASGIAQAFESGNQIFPGATLRVREATDAEVTSLYQSHTYDGLPND